MTSLIRLVVPSSTPFISETKTASVGMMSVQWPRFSRSVCEGIDSTTNSAPAAASSGSLVARTVGGSSIPGKYSVFSWRSLIASHTSGRRPQMVTSWPASASTRLNAVPQEPAPNTATFVMPAPASACSGCRSR